jgi:hypothetical protein
MIWLATATLRAITEALIADGGNKFRAHQRDVLPHITDAYRDDEQPDEFRTYLGASAIGGDCDRALYYGFRWVFKKHPTGKVKEDDDDGYARMIRLWNRGHLEEGRFISLLLMIGCKVYQQDDNGKQFRFTEINGHGGGSGDGIAMGIPDLPPGMPCLIEAKTHSDDSFKELITKGVQVSKPGHFVQMQKYMGGFGLVYALYIAVNKNSDALHMEIVQYDGAVDEAFKRRARNLIFTKTVPARIRNASPGFRRCKYMCDFKDICFGTEEVLRNCRTCAHSEPREDGKWYCNDPSIEATQTERVLSKEDQIIGCDNWIKGSF